jgi:GNAT superfamily N-acetyltransferase
MELEQGDVVFAKLSEREKSELKNLDKHGYVFDWTLASSPRAETVLLTSDGDVAGLVEFERQPENLCNYLWLIEVADAYKGTGVAGKLLAYVGKDALDAGFDGFVVFETKTALYLYYQVKYGAKPLGGRKLFFDTEATQELIRQYLAEEGK